MIMIRLNGGFDRQSHEISIGHCWFITLFLFIELFCSTENKDKILNSNLDRPNEKPQLISKAIEILIFF